MRTAELGKRIDYRRDAFTELIGLEWDQVTPSLVRAHLDVDERHYQPMRIVHGGVYASLVEVAASVGAYLNATPGTITVGVGNNCSFLRPHRAGRLSVVATPISIEARRQLWKVLISRVSDDVLIALGTVELAAVSEDKYDDVQHVQWHSPSGWQH